MNSSRNHACAVIAIGASMGGLCSSHAQDTGKVMIDVAECIKHEAPEARLACYESRVAAVFGERAAQAAAARPAAPAPAASPTVRAPETAPVASSAPTPPPVVSTVSLAPALAPAVGETEQSQNGGDRQSRREEKAQAAESAAASDIVSRVKDARELLPHAYMITLENGQVWRQTVSKQFELRPGQQVRIYGSRWGSASRLSSDEVKGYIQVERVR